MSLSAWKSNLERASGMIDAFIFQNWQSTLSSQNWFSLKGLQYYSPDSSYIGIELHLYLETEVLRGVSSKGIEQEFIME